MKYLSLFLLFFSLVGVAQNFVETSLQLGVDDYFGTGYTGGGISLVDFDKDGYNDITLGTEAGREVLFYKNNAGNGFSKININVDVPDTTHQKQILWADIDNDEDLDLFIATYGGTNKLYRNEGNLNFVDISFSSNLVQSSSYSFGGAFGDINHDGFLDLLVSNYQSPSKLYLNNGDLTFTDISSVSNINPTTTLNFCSAFFDYDRDGDVDLYMINDKVFPNNLYRNDGSLVFTDISAASAADIQIDAMAACVADMNNDGLLDIYVTNSDRPTSQGNLIPGNILLKNDYPAPFQNIQNSSGTGLTEWCWGGSWADFDNDGWQDLYVSNSGSLTDSLPPQNRLYFNNGDETFMEQLSSQMLNDNDDSYACAVGDLNNDGRMDIVVSNNLNAPFKIWLNQMDNTHNFIQVLLEGTQSNKDGIGSWIEVFAGNDTYTRYTHCGIGFLAQESHKNHIGIGTHTAIDSIKISWSSGIVDKIINPTLNTCLTIKEGSDQIAFNPPGGSIPIVTDSTHSISRNWMELLLESIRHDYARPTIHARNLFHSSVVMYDMWAAYQNISVPYFLGQTVDGYTCAYDGIPVSTTIQNDREKAISFAMYRLLRHRFQNSPAAAVMFGQYDQYMNTLGYDINDISTDYTSNNPAALGNYIAQEMITFGLQDGSNEENDYSNIFYESVNDSLIMDFSGNPLLNDFNRWQPLTLESFIDQSGNQILINTPTFLSPEWGNVAKFALSSNDLTTYERNGDTYKVYCDPSAPPYLDTLTGSGNSADYQWGFSLVPIWSAHLDANDPTLWDISPASIGNIQSYPTDFADYPNFYDLLNGGDASTGHSINPITGAPYVSQYVKRGDYTRVLAEFWADGPDSETPPGHWFSLLNYVNDHPSFNKKYKGIGNILDDLEWDVKAYFSLGGSMHDAAVAAWSVKGWYDYIRPVSAVRGMARLGQSSDVTLPSYHVGGIPLVPNYIELVDINDPLVGTNKEHLNKVKLFAWKGPNYINDPATDEAGVGWILAENWFPYQRPSFVTPPFAGYVSGHSTFSRAAAEVLTLLTGSAFFPDGLGQFSALKNDFLVFEEGPSNDLILQWATYQDASDQCSLSRIWGGIHPPADDLPGRIMGKKIGIQGFNFAEKYITGSICKTGILVENGVPIPLPFYTKANIYSNGAVISPDVVFEVFKTTSLEPGFEVQSGAEFTIEVVNCP